MGREVRMVPPDWDHPKNEYGNFKPLLGGSCSDSQKRWDEAAQKWSEGFRRDYFTEGNLVPKDADGHDCTYPEYAGDRPCPEEYMPDWPVEERTHFQMYEDTTEGTPVSPIMPTREALANWLVENGSDTFAGQTATYEEWLAICNGGFVLNELTPEGIITSVCGGEGS